MQRQPEEGCTQEAWLTLTLHMKKAFSWYCQGCAPTLYNGSRTSSKEPELLQMTHSDNQKHKRQDGRGRTRKDKILEAAGARRAKSTPASMLRSQLTSDWLHNVHVPIQSQDAIVLGLPHTPSVNIVSIGHGSLF